MFKYKLKITLIKLKDNENITHKYTTHHNIYR